MSGEDNTEKPEEVVTETTETTETTEEKDYVEEERVNPQFSVNILELIKTAQIQNGLRRADYTRYRQYCTRRLGRIYAVKKLDFKHGRDRYLPKRIGWERASSDKRFLLVPLYSAERAWAFAMERKGDEENPRAHFHSNRRLKKAVRWSQKLLDMCTDVADGRTKLEAEAYHSWMQANLAFEQEAWGKARDGFVKSITIYKQLGSIGHAELQELFKQRVEEINPSVRFCNYKLGDTEGDVRDLKIGNTGAAFELLQSKIDEVLAETRKKQAETMREVVWGEETIPVKSNKVCDLILRAKELTYEIKKAENIDEKLGFYDKIGIALNDAIQVVKIDLTKMKGKTGNKAATQVRQLRGLNDYLCDLRIRRVMDRNLLLVDSYSKKLESPDTKTGKRTKPVDLVRLYDTLIQNANDLAALVGKSKSDTAQVSAAQLVFFRACRCYYLALSFMYGKKWKEVWVLLQRTDTHIRLAIDQYNKCKTSDEVKDALDELNELKDKVRGKRCVVKAKSFLASKTTDEEEAEKVMKGKKELLGNMDEFDAEGSMVKQRSLVEFPPTFLPMSCKPVLFDLAHSSCDFPDLTKRKKKSGFFSFWS